MVNFVFIIVALEQVRNVYHEFCPLNVKKNCKFLKILGSNKIFPPFSMSPCKKRTTEKKWSVIISDDVVLSSLIFVLLHSAIHQND